MRLGRSEGVAFVVGAVVGCVAIYPMGLPPLLTTLLLCLCPGYWAGTPLVGLFGPMQVGLGDILWIVMAAAALANGLLYALGWFVLRMARTGNRAARIGLKVVATGWVAWGVWWSVQLWQPEPPPAPVDRASPLTGRWEGVIHGARGDGPLILILSPRTNGDLDGLYYASGHLIGPIEEGTHADDELQFQTPVAREYGRREGTSLTLESRSGRMIVRSELRFVTADTSRVPGVVQKY